MCSTALKPFASARTVYVPGSRLGAEYSPALSVVNGSRDASGHVRDRYCGACDGAAGLVEHTALNAALIGL